DHRATRHGATSLLVIPAEGAGFCPASESRNPVIKAARTFTPAVDYWVPAHASPVEPGSLGWDDSPYAIAPRNALSGGGIVRRARIGPRKWTMKSLDLVDEDDGPALAAPHALRGNQEIGFVRVGFEPPGAPVHRLHHCFAPRDADYEARRIRCKWVGYLQVQPIFKPAQRYRGSERPVIHVE